MKKITILTATVTALIIIGCTVKAPAPTSEAPQSESKIYYDSLDVLVLESFPPQYQAVVKGNLPNGCARITGSNQELQNSTILLSLDVDEEGDFCTQALVPFEQSVAIDTTELNSGEYTIKIGELTQSIDVVK